MSLLLLLIENQSRWAISSDFCFSWPLIDPLMIVGLLLPNVSVVMAQLKPIMATTMSSNDGQAVDVGLISVDLARHQLSSLTPKKLDDDESWTKTELDEWISACAFHPIQPLLACGLKKKGAVLLYQGDVQSVRRPPIQPLRWLPIGRSFRQGISTLAPVSFGFFLNLILIIYKRCSAFGASGRQTTESLASRGILMRM